MRGRGSYLDHLAQVPMFSACSKKDLQTIGKASDEVAVTAGKTLVQEGTAGHEFFLILDGTARVDVSARKRSRLGPGQYFGEMSLLDGGPRSASVVAETPLRLLVIKRRDFSTLLREATDLTQNLLVTLSHRVRHAEAGLND